jgi:glycosyltransferase involved in cell wall biosynthesis
MGTDKKLIVVSAIALRSGGPLTIVREVLTYLDLNLTSVYRVKALVYSKETYLPRNPGMEITVVEGGEKYLTRLKFEYFTFRRWSMEWEPFLWISLHDISPRVVATRQAVYCHNPSPFYRPSLQAAIHSPTVTMFSLFYKYLYRINISRNDFVIVQQGWLRTAFEKMFTIKGEIIVAYPEQPRQGKSKISNNSKEKGERIFIYPAYPRVFKNHEVLLRTFRYLEDTGNASNARLVLTIDGSENKYSKDLVRRFGDLQNVDFVGLLPHEEVMKRLVMADCLLFPSKLETWGLPITEAKAIYLPIIVADLPYSHETVSNYEKVRFFRADDHKELAGLVLRFCQGQEIFEAHVQPEIKPPFTKSWEELFAHLLEDEI